MGPGLRASHAASVKVLAEATGHLGWDRGAAAKMAPTRGCGQEAWLSCHALLFTRRLEHHKSKEEITVLLIT